MGKMRTHDVSCCVGRLRASCSRLQADLHSTETDRVSTPFSFSTADNASTTLSLHIKRSTVQCTRILLKGQQSILQNARDSLSPRNGQTSSGLNVRAPSACDTRSAIAMDPSVPRCCKAWKAVAQLDSECGSHICTDGS